MYKKYNSEIFRLFDNYIFYIGKKSGYINWNSDWKLANQNFLVKFVIISSWG